MSETVTALKITPGQDYAITIQLRPDLSVLQEHVGGYIEQVQVNDHTALLINENGRFDELPVNVLATVISGLYPHNTIVGPALVVGVTDDGELANIDPAYISRYTSHQ